MTDVDTRGLAKHMGHPLVTNDHYTIKQWILQNKVHTMIQSLISGKNIQ